MVESNNENEDDGFLTTLAALRQVVQPADQLHKQVYVLQKENRTIFEKLEHLRQESQEQMQALKEESQRKLDEQQKEWQQKVQALEQQAEQDRSEFEADLVQKTRRMNEMDTENQSVLETAENERRELEESMIQLESENKALQERCIKSEAKGAKIQAEVRYLLYGFTYICVC